MAQDVYTIITGNPIKNGSTVVAVGGKGSMANSAAILSTDASNLPAIASISGKYDNRFDDPRYYTGDAAI